jgi:hypothetical protein
MHMFGCLHMFDCAVFSQAQGCQNSIWHLFASPSNAQSKHVQWWPAQVQRYITDESGEQMRDASQRPILRLHYQQLEEFPAEECDVAFITERAPSCDLILQTGENVANTCARLL